MNQRNTKVDFTFSEVTGLFLNINTENILQTYLLWYTKYGFISSSLNSPPQEMN